MVAVATGDIVNSSQLAEPVRAALPDTLRDAYAAATEGLSPEAASGLTLVSGDGWQCLFHVPDQALARVLQFAAQLRTEELETRVALALGTVDRLRANLNASDGPALRRSGRGLQHLRADQRFDLLLPDDVPGASPVAAGAIAELCDARLQAWTSAQAQAIAGMLRGWAGEPVRTQAEVAEAWAPEPITRQTVNRHLHRAGWPRLERTLHRFSALVEVLPTSSCKPNGEASA
ncbi:MAG: hypothetical protein GVY12_06395 [Bacteroidetes bacterium]|jgi:hypothetical protein|nr:hypothetical protein [Bacteroidota bacterium]